MTLVSVLINNHNYGKFLGHCVETVLRQTYPHVEIVVYDDGSHDDSLEVLQRYSGKITVIAAEQFSSQPPFNQANAINRAFEISQGDFVCLLDSDDGFLPTKIERTMAAFGEDPSIVLVQHLFREIDAVGVPTETIKPELLSTNPASYVYHTNNLSGVFAQTSALTFRRWYLDRVLPIVPDRFDLVWPDVRLTRQALFFGEVSTLLEPLGEHRVHGRNDSSKLDDVDLLRRVLDQMYEFFNERAAVYGKPQVDITRSIHRPGINRWRRLALELQAAEGVRGKIRYLRGVGRRARKRWKTG